MELQTKRLNLRHWKLQSVSFFQTMKNFTQSVPQQFPITAIFQHNSMTIYLYCSKNWQGQHKSVALWPFTMSLIRKWIDVGLSVNWRFFPSIHSVKTGLIFILQEWTDQLIKPQTVPKPQNLWDLWPFKCEHSVCRTSASLNIFSLCGCFRGCKTQIVLHHQNTAANCKRCSGLFHSNLWFNNKKELTQHFL